MTKLKTMAAGQKKPAIGGNVAFYAIIALIIAIILFSIYYFLTLPQDESGLKMASLLANPAATLGNPDAPVVIIEFSDMQCPACRSFALNTFPLLKEKYINPDKVYFVYKDLPIPNHDLSIISSGAARCAGEQGRFWELFEGLMELQESKGTGIVDFTLAEIQQIASGIEGLGTGQLNLCISGTEYLAGIQQNASEAQSLSISSTPYFIIGPKDGTGTVVKGAQSIEEFSSVIDGYLG